MKIITKEQRHFYFWVGCIIVCLAIIIACIGVCAYRAAVFDIEADKLTELPVVEIAYTDTETATETTTEARAEPTTAHMTQQYMFPGTLDELEAQGGIFYPLTAEDRAIIEQVVMAESGSEPGAGIIAVANCLFNAMQRTGGNLAAALIEYGYTDNRKTPTTEVSECVSAVFDRGELLLDDDVLYFCRSDCESAKTGWHSTLELVCTIGNHNFYRGN